LDRLRLYKVNIDYIKYLYNFDKKVQYNVNEADNYTERRPYVGIVIKIGEYDYYAPLESPRPNHKKLKNNVHIMKIDEGNYGLIAFNNMLPICSSELINFDINNESKFYRNILQMQFIFCNGNRQAIEEHAKGIYEKVVIEKSKFHRTVCCNFKMLEEKCKEYNNKSATTKTKFCEIITPKINS